MNYETEMPSIEAPSISSSAMLVEFSVSNWTGRKKDRSASDRVSGDNGAQRGVASVYKSLLADNQELIAITKFVGNTRNLHYAMTLEWGQSVRLIPMAKYFDYVQTMTAQKDEYWRMVEGFLSNYEWEVSHVQVKLGRLFDARDYPSVESLRRKFAFDFSFLPIAEAGDFRVDIGNEQREVLMEGYQNHYAKMLERAMGDIYERLHKVLSNMSDKLDYGSKETKKIFRDTLVDNVMDIVDLMGTCNVTNDPKLDKAKRDLTFALRGVTPDALREDDYLRRETKKKVDDVLKSLPTLDL